MFRFAFKATKMREMRYLLGQINFMRSKGVAKKGGPVIRFKLATHLVLRGDAGGIVWRRVPNLRNQDRG